MIPVVEDFLKELMEKKLDTLHRNPGMVDQILEMSTTRRNSLKQILGKNPIKVVNGYPRTPAQLPCICILLSNEKEIPDGLGDYGEDDFYTDASSMEEAEVLDYPHSKLPYPSIIVNKKPIDRITSIVDNITGRALAREEYMIANHKLGIIGVPNLHPEKGDTVTVNYSYAETGSQDLRVMYDANFRVEIWTQNGDLTVELYHLTKWALLGSRDELVYDKGLVRQTLSGSDFEPVTSYFPEFVYRRALQFWCQFNTSVSTNTVEYIQDVDASLQLSNIVDLGGNKDG